MLKMDEDGGVRTRWKKTVACMLKEDGGMYNDEEGEDGACRLEKNVQGLGLCSIGEWVVSSERAQTLHALHRVLGSSWFLCMKRISVASHIACNRVMIFSIHRIERLHLYDHEKIITHSFP